ncbi:fumarylacetoacetase [Glycomyces sp. TRM65418]|uniref:fumarylacetoacetase n=1 Tax=Glycomyces sp. TRM65418 TaxID=2867006 RepID=UPI001CE4F8D9|nr:fumarylacetoacetase [Glycomyces sp. TRM65418]MCC3765536.1 fumarylacetoacetase [Glycomyces sp. TRM65418]QZD55143.1 fumarylacetoacetase [Glycomyces sp. TRM65418]
MTATSWVEGAEAGPFDLEHLPYGVFSTAKDPAPRIGVRIGDQVLDLRGLATGTFFLPWIRPAFHEQALNGFMAMGPPAWRLVRHQLMELLADRRYRDQSATLLTPIAKARMHLPFNVADYVDFYASEEHAANLGRLFRPDSEPLLPNWKHLPVGYHGRAGTVVPSGTPIVRPRGQRKAKDGPLEFGPSARLDIETEVGFVVGVGTELGTPVSVDDFAEHVFGVVLVNDWSARDIQAWEYVPLGPFLGKSFATSIGHWVTPLDALAAAKAPAPVQDPAPLGYLQETDRFGYDLEMAVRWNGTEVSRPPFAGMYWTPAQMLAHLTVNGASLRTGDLFASGTVSGPEPAQRGSFLELTWGGKEPVTVGEGETRSFLEDGDTVVIEATAPGAEGGRIGLGEVSGTILPAKD